VRTGVDGIWCLSGKEEFAGREKMARFFNATKPTAEARSVVQLQVYVIHRPSGIGAHFPRDLGIFEEMLYLRGTGDEPRCDR
jgi:hypothetical protein